MFPSSLIRIFKLQFLENDLLPHPHELLLDLLGLLVEIKWIGNCLLIQSEFWRFFFPSSEYIFWIKSCFLGIGGLRGEKAIFCDAVFFCTHAVLKSLTACWCDPRLIHGLLLPIHTVTSDLISCVLWVGSFKGSCGSG